MDTMNALLLAKKLRAQIEKTKQDREREIATYRKAFKAWQVKFVQWVRENAIHRAAEVTMNEVRLSESRYNNDTPSINLKRFFYQSPAAPSYSKVIDRDNQIQSIRSALRRIAVTGQKTIHVSTGELSKWFGVPGEEDD